MVVAMQDGVSLSPKAERLRQERLRLGLTQTQMGELGGVKTATQSMYERDASAPTWDYLEKVSAAGVDVHFVLFGMQLNMHTVLDENIVRASLQALRNVARELGAARSMSLDSETKAFMEMYKLATGQI